ncbi:GNAT family N-acetyltransferase (plasmid) [Saccharopolyspora sp. ID03-671]|uniref:GNAT family N-acetyltransferase n=1 Tax=Saccharopolyspora sp. ID03-671 TaxID=3073066 RepID=UPI0032459924
MECVQQQSAAVEIVHVPARVPAGIDRLDVLVDGVPVGDLLLRLCAPCRLGVIEHLRVDPPHRRRGLGRRLVAAAIEGRTDWTWSTTIIDPNDSARGFARAGLYPGPPVPRWCEHMAAADALMP